VGDAARPVVHLAGRGADSRPEMLVGGRDRPPRRLSRRVVALLTGAALVAGTVALLQRGSSGEAAPDRLDATLTVAEDDISVTQGGVVVLPVELASRGAGLRVRSAEVSASPVRSPPSVNVPEQVAAGGSVRLVAIVQPDCTVLGPGVGGELVATLVVRVVTLSGQEQDLVLAFGTSPALLSRLDGLCRRAESDPAVLQYFSALGEGG
jgi:hypothetical protein